MNKKKEKINNVVLHHDIITGNPEWSETPPFISFPDFIWQLQLFFLSLRKIQRCTKSLISIQDFKNGRQKIYSPTN